MASYTISGLNIPEEDLRSYYRAAKDLHRLMDVIDLDLIFEVAIQNQDRFPKISFSRTPSPRLYILRWAKAYFDARSNPPSRRSANAKTACTDPAIRAIVQETQELSAAEAERGEHTHNLFMSAENVQGNLLEEYIACCVRPYGFIWCEGNTLRAIDFCNTNGTCLLQIKNKSNSENSSSSNIRQGTTIEKWYRLGTRIRQGVPYPDYKWAQLNNIINTYRTEGHHLPPCNMNEESYVQFLRDVAAANHSLITGS